MVETMDIDETADRTPRDSEPRGPAWIRRWAPLRNAILSGHARYDRNAAAIAQALSLDALSPDALSLDALLASISRARDVAARSRERFIVLADGELIDGSDATAALAEGRGLSLINLGLGNSVLQTMCDDIHEALCAFAKVRAHVYISPAGRGLSRLHSDARVACTLQIAGSKNWVFESRAAHPWPRSASTVHHATRRWHGPAPKGEPASVHLDASSTELSRVTLRPGDMLCVPAGALHGATASEDALSISANFGIDRIAPEKLLLSAARKQSTSQNPELHLASDCPSRWVDAAHAALAATLDFSEREHDAVVAAGRAQEIRSNEIRGLIDQEIANHQFVHGTHSKKGTT